MDEVVRQYRMTFRGPGPHRVDHDLNTFNLIVNVLSDTGDQYMHRLQHLDKNSLEVEIGYFSIPARDWVIGCNDDTLIHIWIVT